MEVTVVRLSDGALSVRLDDREVYILPRRYECTPEDLEAGITKVLEESGGGEW